MSKKYLELLCSGSFIMESRILYDGGLLNFLFYCAKVFWRQFSSFEVALNQPKNLSTILYKEKRNEPIRFFLISSSSKMQIKTRVDY